MRKMQKYRFISIGKLEPRDSEDPISRITFVRRHSPPVDMSAQNNATLQALCRYSECVSKSFKKMIEQFEKKCAFKQIIEKVKNK